MMAGRWIGRDAVVVHGRVPWSMVHGSWIIVHGWQDCATVRGGPMDDHEEEGGAARYSREAGAVLGAAHRGCRRGRYSVLRRGPSRHGGLPESWNTPRVSLLLRVGSHGCPSSPDKKPHPGQGPGGDRS
ncbi:hypothetical protein GQ607_015266 [Colletotrichum asianum]|uniref:Uncharacterized protein n=1 Tax=Colletotrichum asianum TaxID=702518 RepID=A0A8H3ZFA7_9PEZI|nr:hypothetical protein GQ607_015266 [Colletotrichum asianum]